MGWLRFLLAGSVVADHSGFFLLMPGFVAVKCFFVISGFLISHVFMNYKSPNDFFKSRFLRLFPVYWITILISIFYFDLAARGNFLSDNPQPYGQTFFERIFQFFQNFAIVSSDLNWFLGTIYDNGISNLDHLIIPPIWSVALEVYFYLLVPFLIRLANRTLVMLIISICFLQGTLYLMGFNSEPWHSRFFVFELVFFLLGMLSYRSLIFFKKVKIPLFYRIFVFTLLFVIVTNVAFLSEFLPNLYNNNFYLYGCLLAVFTSLVLPLLFLKGNSPIGNYLGDLSYLIYIWHYTFVTLFKSFNFEGSRFAPILLISILHAIVTRELIEKRIERYRTSRYRKS